MAEERDRGGELRSVTSEELYRAARNSQDA